MNRRSLLACLFLLVSYKAATMEQEATGNLMIVGTSRSASTVTLRYFLNHSPTAIAYNEPACPIIFKAQENLLYNGKQFTDFTALKNFYVATPNPVVVKEISYGADAFFKAEPSAFDAFDRFVFLVGDPYAQAISLYEKLKYDFDKIENFSWLNGQKTLYEMLQHFKKNLEGKRVVLIKAEELCSQPEAVLRRAHDRLGMKFNSKDLSWAPDETRGRWVEYKLAPIAHHWHGDIDKMTEFRPLRRYLGTDNEPDFKEIENEAHRVVVKKAYLENLAFYEKTLADFADLTL